MEALEADLMRELQDEIGPVAARRTMTEFAKQQRITVPLQQQMRRIRAHEQAKGGRHASHS